MAVTWRVLQYPLLAVLPVLASCCAAVRPPGPTLWPWRPWTQDLEVYLNAASDLVAGVDFYAHTVTFPYIYPPLAALLAVPLTLLPWPLAQLVWTMLGGVLTLAVLLRLGMRGWSASVAAAAVLVLTDPFGGTLRLGQLGIVILALVVFDLVPPPQGRRRLLPAGLLIGLAVGLKLTPAVFVVYLVLIGRLRAALVAGLTFAATVLVGLAAAWEPALGYWSRLAQGDSGANPDAFGWISNLSVASAAQRFLGVEAGARVGLLLAAALLLVALVAARHCYRSGWPVLALGMLGLVSSLANPIAWAHHLTWVLPLAYAAWRGVEGDRAPLPSWLRGVILTVTLWCTINPQLCLSGAPWAREEIFEYTLAQKWFAAGPDVAAAVLVVALFFLPREPAAAVPRHADADNLDAAPPKDHPSQPKRLLS